MENIKVLTLENLEEEHICCAISDKKGENCVSSKKNWLRERIKEGLVFAKLDVRGKVFIEFLPAENAWTPIIAKDYIFINCLWVSGKYKGKGYATKLLDFCSNYAKEKGFKGLVALSSEKKKPFLNDPKFLQYKKFKIADKANPYFVLYYLPFEENIKIPEIKDCAKNGILSKSGWVLYYTNQCPHTEKYAPLLREIAKKENINIEIIKIEDKAQAQNSCALFTTYSLFYNGNFITNEILAEKSFKKILHNINEQILS